ncbi:MAG: MBL fold metallo-hydrolase [Desulfuromonadales bacterium]|nr:MBL fold metallo-hydrolase [Desulfuromonadales bacterium]
MTNVTPIELIVTCVGSGDAFHSGGRLHSCYHLTWGEAQFLLDCGASSPAGFMRCGIHADQLDVVIVSHLHGDHFGGIPYLLLAGKYLHRRTRPLLCIGPEGLQQRVEQVFNALYPGVLADGLGFAVTYRVLDSAAAVAVQGARISCVPVVHGGGAQAFGIRVEIGGRSVSYSGDTEWTEQLPLLAQGSDLFVCECFSYDQPTPGHLDYVTLLREKERFSTQRLVLSHLGPQLLERADQLELELLYDGARLWL